MPDCLNLKELFGDRFRVEAESPVQSKIDPWMLTVVCQLGHVYPHGGEHLGASTNRRGLVAKAIAGLPGVRVVQDGSDGLNAVFNVAIADDVLKILKPRRLRRMSPD